MTSERKLNQYEARLQNTRSRLREALERLGQGRPHHPKLQLNGYKLNVSTLALESGISRTPIYKNHQDIIEDLKKLQARSRTIPQTLNTPHDKINELRKILRETITEHESEKRQMVTENALLLLALDKAEKQLDRMKRKLRKLQDKLDSM